MGAVSSNMSALGEIVRRLVDAYQPERIYLFGSWARGEQNADSDYDLLVVVPDDASPSGAVASLPIRCFAVQAWQSM
jgi:predicted nucleotidyltransferase